MTKDELRQAVQGPWTAAEWDEVYAGLRTAFEASGVGEAAATVAQSGPEFEKFLSRSLTDPEGLGATMGMQVAKVVAAVLFLGMAIRVLRVIAPQDLIWPPRVDTRIEADEPPLVPGPTRPQ